MTDIAFKLHMKKGGSQFNKDQPYVRIDSQFNQKFKMDRLIKTVSLFHLYLFEITYRSFTGPLAYLKKSLILKQFIY